MRHICDSEFSHMRHNFRICDFKNVIICKNMRYVSFCKICDPIAYAMTNDCNPGIGFSILGSGIEKFVIPGSRDSVSGLNLQIGRCNL